MSISAVVFHVIVTCRAPEPRGVTGIMAPAYPVGSCVSRTMANCAVKGWPATTVRMMFAEVRGDASVICWYDADNGDPSGSGLPGATITRLNGTPFAET